MLYVGQVGGIPRIRSHTDNRLANSKWQVARRESLSASRSLSLALFHHYCRRYSPGPAYSDGGGGPVLLITALRGNLLLSCATLSPYRCALRTLRIGIILIITFCPIRCMVDPRCRHPWHHVYRCVDVVGVKNAKEVDWGNCELRGESKYMYLQATFNDRSISIEMWML